MTDSSNVKKNIMYNTIGNTVYLGCQWLITILVVVLSNYNYTNAGILALAMSISSTLYSISSFGMRGYQASDLKNTFSYSTYFKSRIYTSILSIIICIVFLIFNPYDIYTKICIFVYMFFKLSEAFVDVLHGEEQKYWRLDIAGISFFIRGVLSLLAFSLVLFLSQNLIYAIIAMTVVVYIFIIIYDLRKYFEVVGKIKKVTNKSIIKLLVICLPLAIYGILGNGIQFIPKYVLEQFFGNEMLGIYSSIAAPVLIIQTAAMFIFNPLTTLFAEYYINKKSRDFYKLFFKVVFLIIIIGVIGYIGVILFGNFALEILYGESILQYSYMLKQVVLTTVLTAFVWFIIALLTVTRRFKILISSSLIAFVFSIIISYILIPKFDMTGITMTLAITLAVQIIISIVWAKIYLSSYFRKDGVDVCKN